METEKTETHKPLDAIECGLGYDSIPFMYDTSKNIQHVVELPLWDDELADDFYEAIEDAFYAQAAYMRACNYCGKPYPYFPYGLRFNHCNRNACIEKACIATEECSHEIDLKKEREKQDAEERKEKRLEEKAIRKEQELQQPKYSGVIYLMRAENGLYKIGRSKDIEKRLNGLNREIPIKVEVVHTIPTDDTLTSEKILHGRYKAERVKYEWFHLSPAQVEEILSIPPFGIDQ